MFQRVHGMILGLVTVAASFSSGDVQAQVRWGVTFGNGGGVRVGVGNGPVYGPGYGSGYYGPGYGYRSGYGYGPAPLLIAPRPVYVPQPVYVQPQQQYLTQPQYLTTPAGPTPITDGGEVLLFSPSTNQSDVHYALNGHRFTMPPGTKQRLTNDRVWTIQFESSPGQLATYTLSSSRYKFKPTDGGTGLFETQDTPEVVQPGLPPTPGLPPAPIPNPPEVPTLKTTP